MTKPNTVGKFKTEWIGIGRKGRNTYAKPKDPHSHAHGHGTVCSVLRTLRSATGIER